MIGEKLNLSRSGSLRVGVLVTLVCLLGAVVSIQSICAQQQIAWTPQERPIVKQIQGLRQLPDITRGRVTKQLALEIRQLSPSENKVHLSTGLATLSTEGDPGGRATVQEVATTLAGALGEHPVLANNEQPAIASSTS